MIFIIEDNSMSCKNVVSRLGNKERTLVELCHIINYESCFRRLTFIMLQDKFTALPQVNVSDWRIRYE